MTWIQETFQISTVRSCWLAQFTRAARYRQSTARDQSALALRLHDIAHARPRFGYQRIIVMLRREGWPVSRKRVYRLQCLQAGTPAQAQVPAPRPGVAGDTHA